ncbi:MAG: Gfo/Idh/MocA family oxidoreductase [Candidatus Omnitrophica bacterium]|nr:Gfo/Idh/MocA family oxidoreductase [Candidatus Omnitrophota bacterium]
MKILVVGVGSIGMRHLRNAIALGHEAYAVDINPDNLKAAVSIARDVFVSLDEALSVKPQVAVICTFSNDHIKPAIACAVAGCHLFIEKPIALHRDGISGLVSIIKDNSLISMVGCNMRFHPGVGRVFEMLQQPQTGKPLCADLEFGYYLPFAKTNHKNSYQANSRLGGNLIFDDIHELDCAVWMFGLAQKVICSKDILSDVVNDTEDYVEMIIKFVSGVSVRIHMDYLQHGYARKYKVVCDKATVGWDFTSKQVGVITKEKKDWVWEPLDLPLYYNQMYVDEMKYFLKKVEEKVATFNSVEDSLGVLDLALAASRSAQTGQWEKV